MKKILILLVLCTYFSLISQKKKTNQDDEFGCYLPRGEKCNIGSLKNLTVGEINKKFEKSGRIWNAYLPDNQVDISFKSFTMKFIILLIPKLWNSLISTV